MKNNVENIFAEMRRERMYPVNEEQVQETVDNKEDNVTEEVNEEQVNEERAPLKVELEGYNKNGCAITINGTTYTYFSPDGDLTPKEIYDKFLEVGKHNRGRGLAWLRQQEKSGILDHVKGEKLTGRPSDNSKKGEYKPDNSKENTSEEQVNEEMQIVVDAEDILKAADAIKKAQEDGKTVTVTQSAGGFKVDIAEAEPKDDKDPEGKEDEPKGDEPEEEKNESCKKDETCDKDEEICPVCGKKHKKGEKCCEEETSNAPESTDNESTESTNEEVDVAELAARLDECQGSEYMKHALEDGKYNLVKKYLYLKED